jgi:hypothetical protein
MLQWIRMLQVYVPSVSSVFSDVRCKCVYFDVIYVFTHMSQVFYLDVAYFLMTFMCFQVFLQVFETHVSSVFIFLRAYFANVSS